MPKKPPKWAMRELVDDRTWQRLREKLVGTWMIVPVSNVRELERYLAESLSDADRARRLARVHNYLTGSGFRSGKISHPEIDRLLARVRQERGKA